MLERWFDGMTERQALRWSWVFLAAVTLLALTLLAAVFLCGWRLWAHASGGVAVLFALMLYLSFNRACTQLVGSYKQARTLVSLGREL